jgi:hypothetical protein
MDDLERFAPVIVLRGRYTFHQFPAKPFPVINLHEQTFFAIIKGFDTITVVAPEPVEIVNSLRDDGWSGLQILSGTSLHASSVLVQITQVLSEKGIESRVVSTASDVYVFVREENLQTATDALNL